MQKNVDNMDLKTINDQLYSINFMNGDQIKTDLMYLFEKEPFYSYLDNYKEGMSLNVLSDSL